MAREHDHWRIQASVWTFLETLCAAVPAISVHWPDMGGADLGDLTWIEPWLDITNRVGREDDWLYDFHLLINIFSKPTGIDLYAVPTIVGRLCGGLKAQTFTIKSYEIPIPLPVGTGRFLEPGSTDLGRTQAGSADALLRQAVIRCDGLIMPLGI